MKSILLVLMFFGALRAHAATVVLTLTGRVAATDSADFFALPPVSVGDSWTVTLTYEYHAPPSGSYLGGFLFTGQSLSFSVNGLFWNGPVGFRNALDATYHEAAAGSTVTVPAQINPGAGAPGSAAISFIGSPDMILTPEALPGGFSEWNLPTATLFSLRVISRYDAPGTSWRIEANSWETIDIQVIPEPSTAGLAVAGSLLMARRRRIFAL